MNQYLVKFKVLKSGEVKKIMINVNSNLNEYGVKTYAEIRIYNTCSNLGIFRYEDFEVIDIQYVHKKD